MKTIKVEDRDQGHTKRGLIFYNVWVRTCSTLCPDEEVKCLESKSKMYISYK